MYTNAPIQFKNCQLQNVAPSFVNQPPTSPVRVDKGQDLFTMTANSFLNGSSDTNRNKEQLSIVVVDFATEVLYPEIFVSPTTGSNQDRVIKTTAQAADGMYKLKLTDANGNGLSAFSNGFNVIFNI